MGSGVCSKQQTGWTSLNSNYGFSWLFSTEWLSPLPKYSPHLETNSSQWSRLWREEAVSDFGLFHDLLHCFTHFDSTWLDNTFVSWWNGPLIWADRSWHIMIMFLECQSEIAVVSCSRPKTACRCKPTSMKICSWRVQSHHIPGMQDLGSMFYYVLLTGHCFHGFCHPFLPITVGSVGLIGSTRFYPPEVQPAVSPASYPHHHTHHPRLLGSKTRRQVEALLPQNSETKWALKPFREWHPWHSMKPCCSFAEELWFLRFGSCCEPFTPVFPTLTAALLEDIGGRNTYAYVACPAQTQCRDNVMAAEK